MKKQILKSVLCLSLSATMLLSGPASALAETVAPVEPGVEASVETEQETEETTETETTETKETATEAPEETPVQEAAPAADEQPAADAAVEAGADVQAAEDAEEDIDAVGKKIVAPYTLGVVAGLTYDPITHILSWNKVPGATEYRVDICDSTGEDVTSYYTDKVYYNLGYYGMEDTAYVLKVTARNTSEWYVVADNITYEAKENMAVGSYDDYSSKYVGTTAWYTLYKFPASPAEASIVAVLNAKTSQYVSALSQITLKEVTNSYAYFDVVPGTIQPGESVRYEYANNAGFLSSDVSADFKCGYDTLDESAGTVGKISVPLSYFVPGDTIYIRARVYNPNYDYTLIPGQTEENRYSAYVNATYQIPAAILQSVGVVVTESSIRLEPSCSGNVTGFQYQRKNGKKWTDLAKQADCYTDKGLKADTKYTYRVRAYIFNETTKKTIYTGWKTVNAFTWGSALKLKGAAASATSVKLSWSKVSKAEGYEIYRIDTASSSFNVTKGEDDEWFNNATLIKTMKKPKKAAYTDKKLTKGMTYAYVVRAYRTVNKNKCYIEEGVSVSLSEETGMQKTNSYYDTKGGFVVNWQKMTGISGYKVEKQDPRTGQYVAYKTLGKSKASITLPKVAVGDANVTYRIRPYKGNRYYSGLEMTVAPMLPAVKNVKATKTAEGISVSWSAVPGADYYLVYRAKKDSFTYDKTLKTYSLGGSAEMISDVNYVDTSAGLILNPTSYTPEFGYQYDNAVGNALIDNKFYDYYTSYKMQQITGTSVVDKTVKVKALVDKSDDPNYNSALDTEKGYWRRYQKNPDGSLMTKDVIMVEGPKAGNEYFYFVRAVAKTANGANKNDDLTYSAGFTKAARVVYTNVAAAKAAKITSVTSKKKENASIKIKKVKGVKGYAIYRSTKKNKGYVQIGTTTKATYTDTNVTGGKTYYYKVAAYKQTENGSFMYSKLSAAKQVKVKK